MDSSWWNRGVPWGPGTSCLSASGYVAAISPGRRTLARPQLRSLPAFLDSCRTGGLARAALSRPEVPQNLLRLFRRAAQVLADSCGDLVRSGKVVGVQQAVVRPPEQVEAALVAADQVVAASGRPDSTRSRWFPVRAWRRSCSATNSSRSLRFIGLTLSVKPMFVRRSQTPGCRVRGFGLAGAKSSCNHRWAPSSAPLPGPAT